MNDVINDFADRLPKITKCDPIDWSAFDNVLSSIEDINIFDEEYEETILTEFILNGDFYLRGEAMTEAIRHFLSNGYDVLANEGRNGGLALSALCWSSYDRYILDSAKILLNAGAPVEYKSMDDDFDGESRGVLGSIGWKLSGAWSVDKDYIWANILETYYTIVEAYAAGEDYNSINCYLDCIGSRLNSVSKIKDENSDSIEKDASKSKFLDCLVMWFDDKPLVIRKYIDFVIDPVYAAKNKDSFVDVGCDFSAVMGATLVDIRYIDSNICYFDFDNGYRIRFASHRVSNKNRIGVFKIRKIEGNI